MLPRCLLWRLMQLIIALYIQDRRFVILILNSPKEVAIPRSRTQHINISDAWLYTVCHWKSLIDVSDAWTSEWRPRIIFPNILTSILTIKWPASQMLLPRNQSPFRKNLLQLLLSDSIPSNDDFKVSKSLLQIENLILSDKTNIFGDLGKLFMPL